MVTGLPDWLEGRVSVDVAEAMQLTGVPRSTLDRMIREGVLAVVQPLGPRTKLYISVASLLLAFGVPTDVPADTPEGTEGES